LRLAGFKLKDYAEKNMRGNYCIKIFGKDCYFLRRKNKSTYCIAYKSRPKVCRIYPFIRDDIKNCDELKQLKNSKTLLNPYRI
jgi:Fe-S-cluster containining protein